MEPDKEIRRYIHERGLGYGLLTEFTRNKNWTAALDQIAEDKIKHHAALADLGHLWHMINNRIQDECRIDETIPEGSNGILDK